MKIIIDDVKLGRLAADILRVGHAVEVNLMEDGVLGTLPTEKNILNF